MHPPYRAAATPLLVLLTLASAHCGASNGGGDTPSGGGASGASTGGSGQAGTGEAQAGASGAAQGGAGHGGAASAGQSGGGHAGQAGASQAGAGGKGGVAGAAGGKGGAGGTGGAGGGASGGPPADPCAGRLVCETFETTAPGKAPGAPWEVHEAKGTAVVSETRAYGGKRSLKVSIEATTSSDTYRKAMLAITGAPLLPLVNDAVYGRFMIFTDRIPDKSVHWTFAHGDGPLGTLWATYNYGGMGGLMANYYKNSTPDPTDCWQTKDAPFPTLEWSCVAFQLDGKNDEMRFWLDGVEVPELHVVGLSKTDQTCTIKGVDGHWLAPEFKNISVGWESYQHDAAGAHDAWIDDVILDSKPIPCP
jgi:hypothetical protein